MDAIVVAAPPGWEEPAILLAEELGAGKVSACVTGGETRVDSVRAGVAEVAEDAAVLLVHDAARPLLPEDGARARARAARRTAGTAPCRRCRWRTRSSASAADEVVETLPRDELAAVQTPQAFVAPVLLAALAGNVGRQGRARLRLARGGRRRPGAHGGGRPAAAEGHRPGGSRSSSRAGSRSDRRLPHAPPRRGGADRALASTPSSAGSRRPRRAGWTRSASPSTSTTSARPARCGRSPYQTRALRLPARAVRRGGRRGQAARAAGQARARGRLRPRPRGRDARAARARTRGTTCSARCTTSTTLAIDAEPSLVAAVGRRGGVPPVLGDARRGRAARGCSTRSRTRISSSSSATCCPGTGRPCSTRSTGRLPRGLDRRPLQAARPASTPSRSCCARPASGACRSRWPPTRTGRRTSAATSTAGSSTRGPPATTTLTVFEGRAARQEPLG